jgi:nitrogenase iron protein NifH
MYGKGGIGKSTTASNVSAAMADMGLTVMQIGCDPKSDSTRMLLRGGIPPTVLDAVRDGGSPKLNDIVRQGYNGVLCIECGGPRPGSGCAGRGIIAAFEKLEELNAVEEFHPDVVIYDVLGDVVCGGFAMPIRNGYAQDVFVVTSGEMMSLYAASNISYAVRSFSEDGYAKLGGLIQNSRNVDDENEIVKKAAAEMSTKVLAVIGRDAAVQRCENKGMTVIEGEPSSSQAEAYRALAETLISSSGETDGGLRIGRS